MEQTSYKAYPLKYRHIKDPTEEIVDYIDKRRKGIVRSLRTRWVRFNNICMGGIEPNTIFTIAGISGAGKSSFANSLEVDLFELNPNANFVVLSFSWEMLSSKQVGRKLSYNLRKTTTELYSAIEGKPLSDTDYNKIVKEVETIKKYPIYYVETSGNVDEIRETILKFSENEGKGKWIIIMIDHILLTKGRTGESEREIVSKLQYMLMEVKKWPMPITVIQLSQLNRDIESVDRITNPSMHYPTRKDLFGSDSIYQCSDFVAVLHRPEILGIVYYGSGDKMLPAEGLLFLHLLKNRDGETAVMIFKSILEYNRLDEISFKDIPKPINKQELF
jgi:replicative DNA helicase